MANRLQKQPVLTFVPEVRSIAAKAAYCETVQVVSGYKDRPADSGARFAAGGPNSSSPVYPLLILLESAVPAGSNGVQLPAGATPAYGWGRDQYGWPYQTLIGYYVRLPSTGATGGRYSGSGLVPIFRDETTCYPAVEGRQGSPARLDSYENNGWNGGARSISPVPVGGYFDVDIPDSPLGVMIGLSDGAPDHSYSHPTHALVFRPGGVTPVEKGADVGPTVSGGHRVRMARTAGGVKMYVDGVLVYTSNTPIAGVAYVDATLYGLSDYVDNPVIGLLHEAHGEADMHLHADLFGSGGVAAMRLEAVGVASLNGIILTSGTSNLAMQGEGSAFARYALQEEAGLLLEAVATGYGVFGPGQIIIGGINGGQGRLVADGWGSDRNAARASGRFSRPVLTARAGRPEAEVTQAVGVFPLPLGSGALYSGAVMSGDGAVAMIGKASDGAFFGGSSPCATVYQCAAWESYLPQGVMDGGELLFSIDMLNLNLIQFFVLHEGIEIGSSLDIYVIVSMELAEIIGVTSLSSLATVLEMAIHERVALTSSIAGAQALQYAVNAVTGALSRYENFGFKQFATAGGKTYAINDAGLYRLEGENDEGATLNASIDFGASDFGTAQGKVVNSVYAGIATDGCVYLRATGDDGKERIYRAEGSGPERRALTAKGLVSRHWRLRLELVDASYADLDNIEIEMGVSQRRLRR